MMIYYDELLSVLRYLEHSIIQNFCDEQYD